MVRWLRHGRGLPLYARAVRAIDARGIISRHFVDPHVAPARFLPVKVGRDTTEHLIAFRNRPCSARPTAMPLHDVHARARAGCIGGTTSLQAARERHDETAPSRRWSGPTEFLFSSAYHICRA